MALTWLGKLLLGNFGKILGIITNLKQTDCRWHFELNEKKYYSVYIIIKKKNSLNFNTQVREIYFFWEKCSHL